MKIFLLFLLSFSLILPNVFADEVLRDWGSYGREDSQFDLIWDIVIDSQDNVYVADMNNNRIQKFTNQGDFLFSWGSERNLENRLSVPRGLALDSLDNMYVVDKQERILVFNSEGEFLNFFGDEQGLNSPRGIDIDNQDRVYVADTGNDRIIQFSHNGTYLNEFGGPGSEKGEFNSPTDVSIDSQDNVYVTDEKNSRIQKFDSSGKFIQEWPSDENDLIFPAGIHVDSNDQIFVVNTGNHNIVVFNEYGKIITTLGNGGSSIGEFLAPVSMAVDSNNDIFVSDHRNNRIQVFQAIFTDVIPPKIIVPANIVMEVSPSISQVIVLYDVTASDDQDGKITPVCNPPSESFFLIGIKSLLAMHQTVQEIQLKPHFW